MTSFYVELQGHELDPNVAAALDELRALRDAGCSITGCTDTKLETLAVLDAR